MKLPNHEHALVPEQKITTYLLSFVHRDGRSKALFFTLFGFSANEWTVLAAALQRHAADHNVSEITETPFGTSYTVEGWLVAPDGRMPFVRVVCFIETGEATPRLVTAYPVKGPRDD